MALTDARLRNLRPTGKRFELPDRDGLTLRVSQGGTMTWAVSFRVHGAGDSEGKRVQKLAGEKQRNRCSEAHDFLTTTAGHGAIHLGQVPDHTASD